MGVVRKWFLKERGSATGREIGECVCACACVYVYFVGGSSIMYKDD